MRLTLALLVLLAAAAAILFLLPSESPAPTALSTAQEYVRAWSECDFELVWDLTSTPARGLWSEVLRLNGKWPEDPGELPTWLKGLWGRSEAWDFDDPRDLLLFAAKGMTEAQSLRDRIGNETPEVVVEQAESTVTWARADLRVYLGREDGQWRVHDMARGVGGLQWIEMPGGSRVPRAVVTCMTDRNTADRAAWWSRLPRLAALRPEPPDKDGGFSHWEGTGHLIRLFVDPHGRTRSMGKELAGEALREWLFQHAEIRRDSRDPGTPSLVMNVLHLDRDLGGRGLRKLLMHLTDPAIHMSCLFAAARYDDSLPDWDSDEDGLFLFLRPVLPLTKLRIRAEPTARDLILRSGPEPENGTDLGSALTAMTGEARKQGIRLRFGPDVRAERLLRVLQILAQQQEDLRVVLDVRSEEVPEAGGELTLDDKPLRLPDLTGESEIHLTMELWR